MSEATDPSTSSTPPQTPLSPPPVQQQQTLRYAAPLSPEEVARNLRFSTRIWSAFTFVLCTAMLGVGLWLQPDASGTGTHQQLGLQRCGSMAMWNVPCPTCGCTTSVSYFAHGRLLASLFNQPFGFTVALLAALLIPFTAWGSVTGQWRGPSMYWLGWHWRYWTFSLIAILIIGWIYKIIIVRNDLHW